MKDDFAIIAEFLERNGPEVLGRALPTPPPGLVELLERFSTGNVTPEERVAVCATLFESPVFLRLLGHQVKDLRERRESAVPDAPDAMA